MEARRFDDLVRSLLSSRRGVVAGVAGGLLAGLPVGPGAEIRASKKKGGKNKKGKKQRRQQEQICQAVCGGSCAFCQERCAVCEDPCAFCLFEVDGDRLCSLSIPATNCARCATDDDCSTDFPDCLTGFSVEGSGTTQRFCGCGAYPDGVCADLEVLCVLPAERARTEAER